MSGGSVTELVPPTTSAAILAEQADQPHGIAAYGGNFYLYANGEYLTQ